MDDNSHELERSLDALWQCLSQSKRPLGLLLGAGCPGAIQVTRDVGVKEPLIPNIAGLTSKINSTMRGSDLKSEHERLVGGLTEDLGREPNVEDMLTRLRTLATVVGGYAVRDLDFKSIEKLENVITASIIKEVSVDLPLDPTPYDDLAVWIGSTPRSSPVNVFTTNYDLLLEVALERNYIPFFDGFVGVTQPFLDAQAMELDDLSTRWARLWKLHGSANWTLLQSGRVVRRFPRSDEERSCIHPSHLKYDQSRRMPYLLMQDQLRNFLKESSATLAILGYSFRDDHINELLLHGLRANPSATAFGLQYGDLAQYAHAMNLAAEQPGLSLIAEDAAVLAGKTAQWQPTRDDKRTSCGLGDFSQFGKYLQLLVGRSKGSPVSGGNLVAH